ncbi:MAG: 1-(5-phosphoribosyl)-5-((5-phosphoribosylamino)methylideneamino)imidazole-4-carboxamide isomerase [Lachnospiraceae bacterium]|nr:1-(5-phosphoribosyl)-5-((5-phosphoribosylamino)methylideneamino)imidazole-4-carboxamide isomerase [Lachnospiraceae bacterium]
MDLEGAKSGETPNLQDVLEIKKRTGAFCEIGGGIRSMETVKRFLESGVDRVILGTAAVQDEAFLLKAVEAYKERIAVGADIRDGYIAVKGWLQKTAVSCEDFFRRMEEIGIDTVICTDISKDGAMQGTNRDLYKRLSETFRVKITASGGVSSLEDLRALKAMGLYAAIIGKAYYTGAVSLKEAVEEIE